MSLVESLTPKNTKEIYPNFYVQKYKDKYRQVDPLAWNGEIRWKHHLKSCFSFRTIFTIALIIFIAWSYVHDIQEYKEFYEGFMENPEEYCTPGSTKLNDAILKYQTYEVSNENIVDPFAV